MRRGRGGVTLAAMQFSTPKRRRRRLIIDAAIDRSVIRGALITPSGARRDFHGWLELNTALEAILDTGNDHASDNSPAASTAVRAKTRATPAAPPAHENHQPTSRPTRDAENPAP